MELAARDGYPLAGDLFLPAGELRGAVLIAPAMAVRARFYAPFAAFLASRGLCALTLDYRGVGGSRPEAGLRGFDASLHDWAELDLAGGLDLLAARFPGLPVAYFGHSVGGQLFGLLPDGGVARALFVAAQSGYWKHWRGPGRLAMAALWHAGIPAACAVSGKLPMRVLGQGEDVPRGVGLEWARWGRHPDYLGSYAAPRGGLNFARHQGPVTAWAIAGDAYAPEPSVRALCALYTKTRPAVRVIAPAEAGAGPLGHFGFFKERCRETLWPQAAELLLG